MALASISVDLDTLPHYLRLHGLPENMLDARLHGLVYGTALERFLGLFQSLKIRGTLFVIGEDLAEGPERAALLQRALGLGLELGNHSHTHPYALARLPPAALQGEIEKGAAAIENAVGVRPLGFRAPGYTLSSALLGALETGGYRYDSSVFPAAPYWFTKAVVMGGMRLVGKTSRAVLDRPQVLFAPRLPYHPSASEPYRRGELRLLELPISVERRTRLPLIGATVTLLPKALVRHLYRSLRQERFVNFELHAIDLLGKEDGLPAVLVRRQPDLGLSVAVKLQRIRELFTRLSDDFEVVPLLDAAVRLGARGSTTAGRRASS